MTKLCPRGKAAAKRKFKVYPSAYANAYASKICAGKAKDPSGLKRKDWGPKKKKEGGQIKIKKVAKALHKASGLHKQQAKTLDSIKKAEGGMAGAGSGMGRLQKYEDQKRRRPRPKGMRPMPSRPGDERRMKPLPFDPNKPVRMRPLPYRPGEDEMPRIERMPFRPMDKKPGFKREPLRPKPEELKQMRQKIRKRKTKDFNQGGMAREQYQGSYIKSDLAGEPVSNKSYEAYYKDLI
jgi:hypothetical protein|tara:strand:- start:118 stop:828 length:711 start_codon:yes stop_codon:yes gene_type:complete